MTRSILAVLGGWGIAGVFVVLTDLILGYLFPNEFQPGKIPPDYLSGLSLATSILYSVLGGWLTARIAARKHWAHILGLIIWGELVGIVSTVLTRGQIQNWYQIGLIVGWLPAVSLGGYFRIGHFRFQEHRRRYPSEAVRNG